MTVIAAAISVAYLYSVLVQAHIPGQVLYWQMATVIDAVLLGYWIELRSVLRTTVEVTGIGQESCMAQVVELVERAGEDKSRTQRAADGAAFAVTVIALAGSCATLGAWLALGKTTDFAVERMVTVLLIACPHALGLAVSLVVTTVTALAVRNGLLVRHRTPFENAHRLHTIVLGKTGTLTRGELSVSDAVVREESKEAVQRLHTSAWRSS